MKYTQLAIAYNNPLLEVNVTGYNLTAGDENGMSISIENVGGENAYDVKASLTVPSTVSGISIVKGSFAVFEKIYTYGDTTKWMHPVLYVESDCPLGAYSLTLELEYTDSNDKAYIDSVQIGVVVDAIEPATVDLDVDAGKYHITAGTENEININVTNIGEETVYDIEAMLTSPGTSMVVLRELSYVFDKIDVGGQIDFRPVIGVSRSVTLGAYSLTLTLDYKDSKGVAYHKEVTVGVFVDSVEPTKHTRIVVQEFQISPTEIYPGDALIMEMELKNWGANAHDVQVQLAVDSESPLVSLDPTLVFVGDMKSNQTAKVVYNLNVSGDADALLYVLSLDISYNDLYDQARSLTEAVSIRVQSIIGFRLLDVQPSQITAVPGEIVEVEADLLLLGTETVDFVEIGIDEDPSSPILSVPESYEYIGRVDPDSPVLFTIQFMVDPNATSGSYVLQMNVSCWDGYNKQRQTMIELPVIVNEASGNSENTSVSLWDIIWTVIRILLGMKP